MAQPRRKPYRTPHIKEFVPVRCSNHRCAEVIGFREADARGAWFCPFCHRQTVDPYPPRIERASPT